MSPFTRLRQAQEIENRLIERLPAWRDADGRLPSEIDLATEFGVSRVTVREALASLERRGLILRKQGLGTFVNRRAVNIQTRLDESIEFNDLIRASGYQAGVHFLECLPIAASAENAHRLLLQPGAPLIRIRKVFTANQRPLIYCTNFIPLDLAPAECHSEILNEMDPAISIYSLLFHWFQQVVDYQISDAEACSATEELAQILDCRPQTPLFRIDEVGYTLQQRPVFTGDTYFLPGMIRFRLVRKPIFTIG